MYVILRISTPIYSIKFPRVFYVGEKMADAYEEVVGGALKLKGVADGGVKKWAVVNAFICVYVW